MSTQYLTAPQALRAVAEKIINDGYVECGLCGSLLYSVPMSLGERCRALDAVCEHVEDGGEWEDGYLAPPGTEHEARAMFALLIAEQLEDEGP